MMIAAGALEGVIVGNDQFTAWSQGAQLGRYTRAHSLD
jgi:hypothetical protein